MRRAELAVYHTRTATGISTVSHLVPPNKAANPRMTNIAVAPVDFFKSALIRTPKQNEMLKIYPRGLTLPSLLAVEFALVALEADAGYAQANQREGEKHFPVRGG